MPIVLGGDLFTLVICVCRFGSNQISFASPVSA